MTVRKIKNRTINAADARGAMYLTAAVYLIWLLLSLLLPQQTEGLESVRIYEYGMLMQFAALLIPAAFWCSLRGEALTKRMRLSLFSPAKAIFLLLFSAALISGAVLAAVLTAHGSSSLVIGSGFSGSDTGLIPVLCVAVFPAVAEEVFFRGVLMTELEACGAPAAVILSSLLFAMFHFSPEKLPLYFFSGLLLALCVYVSRSLLASVCVHLAYNLTALYGTEKLNAFLGMTDELALPAAVLTVVLLICLILIFGECQRTYAVYAEQNRLCAAAPRKGAGGFLLTLFSPAGAVCIIIFIVAMLL